MGKNCNDFLRRNAAEEDVKEGFVHVWEFIVGWLRHFQIFPGSRVTFVDDLD